MAISKKTTAATPAKKAACGAKKTVDTKKVKATVKKETKVETKVSAKAAKTVKAAPAKKEASKDVVFSIDAPLATTVAVAGCFNNWSVTKNKLKKDKKGVWSVKIPLAAGRYEYKFVCDGVNWDEGENKVKNV